MNLVKIPSGAIVNIDHIGYVVPLRFETVKTQILRVYSQNGSLILDLEKEDAVFLYWFMEYNSTNTEYTGFDKYFEKHKNDKISLL
jgi:hypothetical protein